MKTFALLPVATALILFAGAAHAGSKGFSSNQQYWKQQQILKEEWRRAREVGGYNDPVTAMSNIANGRATEKDIRSGVTSIYDTPNYGTIRLKGRWD